MWFCIMQSKVSVENLSFLYIEPAKPGESRCIAKLLSLEIKLFIQWFISNAVDRIKNSSLPWNRRPNIIAALHLHNPSCTITWMWVRWCLMKWVLSLLSKLGQLTIGLGMKKIVLVRILSSFDTILERRTSNVRGPNCAVFVRPRLSILAYAPT